MKASQALQFVKECMPLAVRIREPLAIRPGYKPLVTNEPGAALLLAGLQTGSVVFVHSAAMAPTPLMDELARVCKDKSFTNVQVIQIHTEGPALYNEEAYAPYLRSKNFFLSSSSRLSVQAGRSDYVPCHLSDVSKLLRTGAQPVDIVLL